MHKRFVRLREEKQALTDEAAACDVAAGDDTERENRNKQLAVLLDRGVYPRTSKQFVRDTMTFNCGLGSKSASARQKQMLFLSK